MLVCICWGLLGDIKEIELVQALVLCNEERLNTTDKNAKTPEVMSLGSSLFVSWTLSLKTEAC